MEVKKLEKVYFYNSSQRDIVADIAVLAEKLFLKNGITQNEEISQIEDFTKLARNAPEELSHQ